MKKSIIALMGLFTLVACSEDSYQEADKMNETRNGSVENTEPQNSVKSSNFEVSTPYEDSMFANAIDYSVWNTSATYTMEVTPYIGLAYYDGADDGYYSYAGVTLDQNSYPNLFKGGKEYLNLIKGNTVIIPPLTNSSISSGNHCPVMPGQAFDLTASGGTASVDEINLLEVAGKVYYADVVVKNGPVVVLTTRVKQIFHYYNVNSPLTSFGSWNYLGSIAPGFIEPFYSEVTTNEIAPGNRLSFPASVNTFSFVPITGERISIHTNTSDVIFLLE